jgi:tetratricopeptide (TPR) repeat protein
MSLQMGEYAAAQRYIEQFMRRSEEVAKSGDLASAYSLRAEIFRAQGATDRALADLSMAANLLAASDQPCCQWQVSLALHLRLERARALGQYDHVCALAEEIGHLCGASIDGAEMALDQAEYAAQCGVIDDVRRYALQAAHLGRTLRSRFFVAHARSIVERTSESVAG